MKLFFIFLFTFFSFQALANMSQEEIVNGFNAPEKSVRSDSDYQDRVKNLAKEREFFGQHAKKKKPTQTQKFTGNGADLSQNDAPVVNQWNGTCTAHGLAASIETSIGNIDISERHVWSKYKQYSCEAAINAWTKGKCMTNEKSWPHGSETPKRGYTKAENCNVFLKKATFIDDDIQAAINALDNKKPVYLGMNVTQSMMNCDATIYPKSRKVEGGHAIAIVGYYLDDKVLGGGYFKIKNSWGTNCGDKGYQYVPFYHCQRNDLYCIMWTIDEVVKK